VDNLGKNDGQSVILPLEEGQTAGIELFIPSASGQEAIGAAVVFGNSRNVFTDLFIISESLSDGIFPVVIATATQWMGIVFGPTTFPDGGYFCTVYLTAKSDVPEGTVIEIRNALLGLSNGSGLHNSLALGASPLTVEFRTAPAYTLWLDANPEQGNQREGVLAGLSIESEFVIEVWGDNVAGAVGFGANLTYNPSVVTFTEVIPGDLLPKGQSLWESTAGDVGFGVALLGGTIGLDTGLLATLKFRAGDRPGETNITLTNSSLRTPEAELTNNDQILVTVRTVLPGDFDGNGSVDFSDFLRFAVGFGDSVGDPNFDSRLDLDGDGNVGFTDFLTLATNFGRSI
jgi:hypothetical protein